MSFASMTRRGARAHHPSLFLCAACSAHQTVLILARGGVNMYVILRIDRQGTCDSSNVFFNIG